MRLLYLDEAGIDFKAAYLYVGGLIVHGDVQWPEIDYMLIKLVEKYVPREHRDGFYFSAKDIYHGSGYFDRRKPEWSDEAKRHYILCELANIIELYKLPLVCGNYEKSGFGFGMIPDNPALDKHNFMHSTALIDCLLKAEDWLEYHAPNELATVVHEDGTPAKQLIKRLTRALRSNELLDESGMDKEVMKNFKLPIGRIIDTVHFAEKQDARPLQLADLCAFSSARMINQRPIPEYVAKVIADNMRWVSELPLESRNFSHQHSRKSF